jgi:CheY-like chemotaxis protein
MARKILAVAPDLLIAVRIEAAARQSGAQPVVVPSGPDALVRLGDTGFALVVVDLSAPGVDLPKVARAAREAGIPVLAFGPHVDKERLQAARDAGISHVLPRGRFLRELPRLLSERAK